MGAFNHQSKPNRLATHVGTTFSTSHTNGVIAATKA
jgi:hypothetical protein